MSEKPLDSACEYIIEAFYRLFARYPIDKITVNDIVKKAGVSRSTFYLHFEDKFDLLGRATRRVLDELSRFYNSGGSMEDVRSLGPREWLMRHNAALCEHVHLHGSFYLRRLRDIEFVVYLSALLKNWMQASLLDESRATFAAHGTIGLLREWLENERFRSIDYMARKLTNIAFYLVPDFAEAEAESDEFRT
ncbi:TetR/AcrR family transcriptional regulator [Cohnella cellulosilytica]|uniref:TetR/AcrR family transcriptional regulator n=1 Tax=Cohnella cellulosilytica TaxID=986710 RepID=A0ABW2F5V8_9BACL